MRPDSETAHGGERVAQQTDIERLGDGIRGGDRRALAQGITLIESDRADHRDQAADLMEALRGAGQAVRIGLSGAPGVGKSTFIDGFGTMLTGQGKRVAVLAVDPSSALSGGSILGDKTRMDRLARDPHAFVRPSPSRAHPGGVARSTRESVELCEAAGYDVVIVETVGVGQSEILVADMSDVFALLVAPAGGDELQGVKRGIMEFCDVVLVNKADGDLRAAAERTCADYAGALRLLRRRPSDPDGHPLAMTVSALREDGLDAAWERISALARWRRERGHLEEARAAQARRWFEEEVRRGLLERIETPDLRARIAEAGVQVEQGSVSVSAAARRLLRGLGDS